MNFIKKQLLNLAIKSGVISVPTNRDYAFFGRDYSFGKYKSDSQLIEEGYLVNNAVYSVVNISVNASLSIPIKLYKKTKDGLEEVESGGLFDVMQNPNEKQIFKEFHEEALTYLITTGDLFINGTSSLGFGDAFRDIRTLPSNRVELQLDYLNELTHYEYQVNGMTLRLQPNEVFHGKYIDPSINGIDGKRGLSPFQAGYRTITASNENLTAMASVWNNKGASGLLTSNTDETLSVEEAQDIQRAVNAKLGGSNKANEVAATTANVKFVQIGMHSSDMELLQSSPQLVRGICMLIGVDPALLGDTESRKYSNLKEAEKSLFVRSAIPNNERLISYLNRFLVPAWSKNDGVDYVIKQDITQIESLQPDKKLEAEKNKIISEALTSLLSSNLSPEAKELILIDVHGVEETKANILANSQESSKNQQDNNKI